MESFWDLFKPEELIRYGGLGLVLLLVLIENGIFFGFFLPGDSLLFTSGLLCYYQVPGLTVELPTLILSVAVAAIGGYYFGYYFGYKTGQALYNRKESFFFKKSYVNTAQSFYARYGGPALIMGRFLPIVRTFAPILAGVVKVSHRDFFLYNIAGALLWPGILISSGYFIGKAFPDALNYLDIIIVTFIVITAVPVISNIRKQHKNKTG
jgi:membrane-associated protein